MAAIVRRAAAGSLGSGARRYAACRALKSQRGRSARCPRASRRASAGARRAAEITAAKGEGAERRADNIGAGNPSSLVGGIKCDRGTRGIAWRTIANVAEKGGLRILRDRKILSGWSEVGVKIRIVEIGPRAIALPEEAQRESAGRRRIGAVLVGARAA